MITAGDKVILKAGWGYFDISYLPIGGSFKRAKTDINVTVTNRHNQYHGTTVTGITEDNLKIAFGCDCIKQKGE